MVDAAIRMGAPNTSAAASQLATYSDWLDPQSREPEPRHRMQLITNNGEEDLHRRTTHIAIWARINLRSTCQGLFV